MYSYKTRKDAIAHARTVKDLIGEGWKFNLEHRPAKKGFTWHWQASKNKMHLFYVNETIGFCASFKSSPEVWVNADNPVDAISKALQEAKLNIEKIQNDIDEFSRTVISDDEESTLRHV